MKSNLQDGCIYCGSTQPPQTREHVIPVAMGSFEHNWTLDCVCDACNHFFSKELELAFARDTAEGHLRIEVGVKPPTAVKNLLNRRSSVTLKQPGPFDGTRMQLVSVEGKVTPSPVPQVAFRRPGEEWSHLVEGELTVERLTKAASGDSVEVKLLGKPEDIKRLRGRLNELQFFFSETDYLHDAQIVDAPVFTVEHSFFVDATIRRAAAKIVFNYVAKVLGCTAVKHTDFDIVRRFIRYGEEPDALVCVNRMSVLVGPQAATSRTHACGIEWSEEKAELLGLLSLFNEITYGVRLCRNQTNRWHGVSFRHFFNPLSHTISEAQVAD